MTDTAGTSRLDRVLDARSIAIVGVSERLEAPGRRCMSFIRAAGYDGAVYPISPRGGELEGRPVHRSLTDLPEVPDLAVISVPAAAVEGIVAECASLGVGSVIVFSSGFSEIGEAGDRMQRRIAESADAAGMTLIGPNSLGVVNFGTGAVASFGTFLDRPAPSSTSAARARVGVLSQSGAMASFLHAAMADHGIELDFLVSMGNEAVYGVADALSDAAGREDTEVVAVYLETCSDVRGLRDAAARAVQAGKKVLVLKVGRSPQGRAAAASHTGRMIDNDEILRDELTAAGAVLCEDLESMIEIAAHATSPAGLMFGDLTPHASNSSVLSPVVVTVSGGAGVWLADRLADDGIDLRPFHADLAARLADRLPAFASVGNPIDVTAGILADPGVLAAAVTEVLDDPGVSVVGIVMGLQERNGATITRQLLAALPADAFGRIVMCWLSGPDEVYRLLDGAGAHTVRSLATTARLLSHLHRESLRLPAPAPEPASAPVPRARDVERSVLDASLAAPGEHLDEHASKSLLSGCALDVPRSSVFGSATEFEAALAALPYPVVMKGVSAQVIHKTDEGLVELDLATPEQARKAWARIETRGRDLAVGGLDSILVEEQVAPGPEFVVGTHRDPSYGLAMMVGAGGVNVELYRDVRFGLLPMTREECARLLDQVRATRLIRRWRGGPDSSDALVEAVFSLACLADDLRDVVEAIEINPLRVVDGRVYALDAVVTRSAEEGTP